MALFNSVQGYGALTKALHWGIVGLFAFQYLAGLVMTRLGDTGTLAGYGRDAWYNGHKSLGLVALAVALVRLWARQRGTLPDWAPTLTGTERHFIMRAETLLYAGMLAMPVSGFLYVMAGGFGVQLFGLWPLPNPIGKVEWLGLTAKWVHIGSVWLVAAAVLAHLALVLRHTLLLRDGLLARMLPQRDP